MLFGIRRTERLLGLHPKPCRGCSPAADRLVSRRRFAYHIFGMPLLALDARWRRCTGCTRRFAIPRLSLPTTVFATLILAWLLGLGIVVYGDLFVWTLLALFWGVWLAGHVLDSLLDRRLVPIPSALYRPAKPVDAGRGAGRRAQKSLLEHRPVGRWRRYLGVARIARASYRTVRRVRRRREEIGPA